MTLLVIANPTAGAASAPQFLITHVLPLLDARAVPYVLKTTDGPGHAGQLAVDFLDGHDDDDPATIVIGGGDGSVHEVVNSLVSLAATNRKRPEVRLVLLPLGTANALYHSFFPPSSAPPPSITEEPPEVAAKLHSLAAFLDTSAHLRPLTLSKTTFYSGPSAGSSSPPEPIISCVVTSTCLHAAILNTAEHLRAQFTGVERFKEAARRNINKWYTASRATLIPIPFLGVQRYDRHSDSFVKIDFEDGSFAAEPFAYFLSTVNVDRLEQAFTITPLERRIPPVPRSMDVLLMRPRRDPSFHHETESEEQVRERLPGKVMQVMQAAYDEGKHVQLRYDEDGGIGAEGDGPPVVEYYRCAGWEWEPEATDKGAHLVCADGTIVHIPKGGRARCRILSEFEQGGRLIVWA